MTGWKKHVVKFLGRLVMIVVPQFFGRAYTEKQSSLTVTETHRTEKTERRKK